MNLAAMLLYAASAIGPVSAESLDRWLWESRPILVFADAGDPRIAAQMQMFEQDGAALEDRRNIVVLDTAQQSPLRARFQPKGFTVILVGLDGGEKFRSGEIVAPAVLNMLIDGMPMRRQELRRRGE